MCIIIFQNFYCNSSFINESFYGHVGAARTWLLVWLKKILAFEAWLFIFFELHAWKQPFSEPESGPALGAGKRGRRPGPRFKGPPPQICTLYIDYIYGLSTVKAHCLAPKSSPRARRRRKTRSPEMRDASFCICSVWVGSSHPVCPKTPMSVI